MIMNPLFYMTNDDLKDLTLIYKSSQGEMKRLILKRMVEVEVKKKGICIYIPVYIQIFCSVQTNVLPGNADGNGPDDPCLVSLPAEDKLVVVIFTLRLSGI